jgi:hypothetical protein
MQIILLLAAILTLSGCKDCNKVENPVSPDYPCGTQAHICSLKPLSCCWNSEVCGGLVGTGCPAGMCCFVGEDFFYTAAPKASGSAPKTAPVPSAMPGAARNLQWVP